MFNQWIGIGNMTADSEVRYSQNGNPIATFTLACDSGFGDYKHTEFMRCVCMIPKLAEIIGEYGKKGQRYMAKGAIQTRKWQDQSGNDRFSTECKIEEFKMLSSKSQQKGGDYPSGGAIGAGGGFEEDVPF